VAYRYFSTARRKFIIADTPGHEQYTRNMATGASTCDLAIILIDARHGVQVQTRRHSFIVSLLGLKHTVVAINKMDLVDYSEERYEQIKAEYRAFASQLDLPDIQFVPLSALKGDNVVNRSEFMPWYRGQTLMETLESVEIVRDQNFDTLRFPVQYVNRPSRDFRGYCGTLTAGVVRPGDEVTVLPSGKTSKVKSIVTFDGELSEAFPPMSVTLTLEDQIDISRGDILVHSKQLPQTTDRFDATLVWMAEQSLVQGKTYDIKLLTGRVAGAVTAIRHRVDVNSLHETEANTLALNEIGRCELTLEQPVLADNYKEFRSTGSFIVVDRLTHTTVAAGMILPSSQQQGHTLYQSAQVTAAQKARRFGQQAAVVYVKGEANAARTLVYTLEKVLFDAGRAVATLHHDNLQYSESFKAPLAMALKANGLLVLTDTDTGHSDLILTLADLPEQGEQVAAALEQLREHKIL